MCNVFFLHEEILIHMWTFYFLMWQFSVICGKLTCENVPFTCDIIKLWQKKCVSHGKKSQMHVKMWNSHVMKQISHDFMCQVLFSHVEKANHTWKKAKTSMKTSSSHVKNFCCHVKIKCVQMLNSHVKKQISCVLFPHVKIPVHMWGKKNPSHI